MITYIRFNNFYSYAEATELLFTLGKQPPHSNQDFHVETVNDRYRLNKITAILGANGSGKTQLLKAIAFLRFFMAQSTSLLDSDEPIPFSQFAMSQDAPSEFEFGFLLKSDNGFDEYRYELTLTQTRVVKEALYKKTSRQFSYIFIRHYEDGKLSYKHRNFLIPSLADDVKTNASLISYARLLDAPIADSICDMLEQYKTNVASIGRIGSITQTMPEVTELFAHDDELKQTAEALLCQFDTGITKINIKKVMMINEGKQQEALLPFGVHNIGDESFELIFLEESNGTQSAYSLLGLILPILKNGGVAIIDELDNDLHPLLLPAILDLFRSSHHNPHNAQLIFSCHTPEVFNLLNKHQIYLVEKYEQASEAWRLDEMEGVRNDDNLYAKYMAGAFDAIPNL